MRLLFEKMIIIAPWIPFAVVMLAIFLLVGCATAPLPAGLTPEIVKMCEEQGSSIILDSDVEKIKKDLSSCSSRWQDGS